MKQAKWLLLLAVGMLIVLPGCKQLGKVSVPVKAAATTYNIYAGNGDDVVGTCTISNDASNFYVTIDLTMSDYWIREYHIWVGDDILDIVPNPGDPPEQWKRPPPGSFPYKMEFTEPGPTKYTVTIPYTPGWNAYYFVIHLALGNPSGDHPTAYVGGTKVGHWWWYLQYTPTTPPPPEYREETAWGYDIYDDYHHFDNWGVEKWGGAIPYKLGQYPVPVDLWAGAGNNNPAAGKVVGSVTITDDYDGTTCNHVWVTYTLNQGVMLAETHAGAAVDMPTLRDNSNDFAPGQLGVTHEFDPWVPGDVIELDYDPAWGHDFVVAAHAVVEIPIPAPPPTENTSE